MSSDDIKPQRIDPEDCGCTDCLTGYSQPLSRYDTDQWHLLLTGQVANATHGAPWSWLSLLPSDRVAPFLVGEIEQGALVPMREITTRVPFVPGKTR